MGQIFVATHNTRLVKNLKTKKNFIIYFPISTLDHYFLTVIHDIYQAEMNINTRVKDHRKKGYTLKRDEGHVLRRIMLDASVPGKRREEDKKPGRKTRVKELYGKCWVKGGERTGQDKVEE